jgi:hypothetical protein
MLFISLVVHNGTHTFSFDIYVMCAMNTRCQNFLSRNVQLLNTEDDLIFLFEKHLVIFIW